MAKISQQNRKFFLKWRPFNFCDRFCERCFEMRGECPIYQEDVQFKMECLREGKDPEDSSVIFERIEKTISETLKMIDKGLKEKEIRITKKDHEIFVRKISREEKKIQKHPLSKSCAAASLGLYEFLSKFNPGNLSEPLPWATGFWKQELEELYFYGNLISVKADSALFSHFAERKTGKISRPDWLVSAAISYYSILTVKRSLENIVSLIRESEPIWAFKVGEVIKKLGKIEEMMRETFPGVEKFRDKIIFHGRLK